MFFRKYGNLEDDEDDLYHRDEPSEDYPEDDEDDEDYEYEDEEEDE